MPRKKISVVNIDENDNKNDDVIDAIEPVNEPIEIKQEVIEKIEKVEEPIETVETPPVEETAVTQPESATKTRVQELIKCNKCNKMVTPKTLKYSHKNTCSGEEQNNKKTLPIPGPAKIEKPKTKSELVQDIEDIKQSPKLNRTIGILPDKITITPEMMREHRQQIMRERTQLRQNAMKNLFDNSIR